MKPPSWYPGGGFCPESVVNETVPDDLHHQYYRQAA